MWQTKLIWFLIGWNVAIGMELIRTLLKIRGIDRCTCQQCGSRYWMKNSLNKKYPTMFCDHDCERNYTFHLLVSKGCSVEAAAKIASLDEEE